MSGYRLMALGVAVVLLGIACGGIAGGLFESKDVGLIVAMVLGALGGSAGGLIVVEGWRSR